MSGVTILPMPLGAARLYEMDPLKSDHMDLGLKNNIEEIVTKWNAQVNDILDENNSRANDKIQPLPSAGNLLNQLN